jgi:flagellar biosynthesis GTPase FlhF
VCFDAGRPEKEYTSHYVKDQPGPNGKVICPTLLNQACRICNKTGHTSSYCPQYRSRREERYIEREQPRREERYIEREPRREERYIDREPRREERYIEREPRREERYIERETRREERYNDHRGNSYDGLREDTERRERETRDRDEVYYREQERRSKPWLQAALKPAEQQPQRRQPYAHPHGPRVRLSLEVNALCASKHAVVDNEPVAPVIDVRKMKLNHAANWGDEDAEQPFVCDPEKMTREFLQECIMANLTTSAEHDFIAECDNQSSMPFFCGE